MPVDLWGAPLMVSVQKEEEVTMKAIRKISAAPVAVAVITVLVTVVGAGVKFT